MKKRDYGRMLLMTLLTLAVMAGGLSWLTWRETRQQRLNRALIAAILHADTPAALSLLDAEADPNTHLEPDPPRSAWQLLLDRVRGRRPPPNASDTALLMVMDSLVKQRDRRGLNAHLMFAAVHGDTGIAEALLQKGAAPDARNILGDTALMNAAAY
jgi:ankyrin repeat protein